MTCPLWTDDPMRSILGADDRLCYTIKIQPARSPGS